MLHSAPTSYENFYYSADNEHYLCLPCPCNKENFYYVTNQQMYINTIYFTLLNITIHGHVTVASTAIIRVSCKKTNNISTNVHKVQLKPPAIAVSTSSAPCGHKMSKYRSFATTVSQLKMCSFSGETFKCFEVL